MQITVKRLISGEVDAKGLAKYKEAPLEVENDHLVSSVVGKATKAMGLDGSKEWVLTTSEGIPLLSGGDMKSAKDMGVYYLAATGLSMAEVEPHRVNKDCWVVIDAATVFDASDFGHFVYDVSAYINDHPGGKEIVLKQSGKDSTREYVGVGHSKSAKKLLAKHVIAQLSKEDSLVLQASAAATSSSSGSGIVPYVLGFLILVAALAYQFVLKK